MWGMLALRKPIANLYDENYDSDFHVNSATQCKYCLLQSTKVSQSERGPMASIWSRTCWRYPVQPSSFL